MIQHAADAGKFNFWPSMNLASVLGFMAALFTMMLGSIPQQDVFQRITSSKNVTIAVQAAILGGVLYFCFAFVPLFLAYSATLIDPDLVKRYLETDSQMILPRLVLERAPLIAQIMFFGALLSAIKSCASATLLAPSVTFSENILKGFFKRLTDRDLLKMMRVTVLCFTVIVTFFAMNSQLSIFKMVESAYKVTLVSAFIPLTFGIYWKRANPVGGLLSVLGGLSVWIVCEVVAADAVMPPQLAGLLAGLLGMLAGGFISNSKLVPAQRIQT